MTPEQVAQLPPNDRASIVQLVRCSAAHSAFCISFGSHSDKLWVYLNRLFGL